MNTLLSVWNHGLALNTFEQAQKVLINEGELLWLVVHDPAYPHSRHLAQTFRDDLEQLKRKLRDGDSSNLFLYPRDFHSGDHLHGELVGIEENVGRSVLDDRRVPRYLRAGGSWQIGWAFRLKSLHKVSPGLFRSVRPLVAPNWTAWPGYGRPFPCPGEFNAAVELRQELLAPTDKYQVGGLRVSPDFRSANLNGELFYFTPVQAQFIEVLFGPLKNGTPALSEVYILDRCGYDKGRLRDHFKNNPAWCKLIIPGPRQGTFMLAN